MLEASCCAASCPPGSNTAAGEEGLPGSAPEHTGVGHTRDLVEGALPLISLMLNYMDSLGHETQGKRGLQAIEAHT